MSKAIHKFQMYEGQTATMAMLPRSAVIVGAGFQGYQCSIWFERDVEDMSFENWELRLVGTGEIYDDDLKYLAGPIVMGDYVFHVVGRKA